MLRFRMFVVVDEAKVLVTEGHKFGLGLILASRLEEHVVRETLANAAWRVAKRPWIAGKPA